MYLYLILKKIISENKVKKLFKNHEKYTSFQLYIFLNGLNLTLTAGKKTELFKRDSYANKRMKMRFLFLCV